MQDSAHAIEEKLAHMVEMHGEFSEFISSRRQADFILMWGKANSISYR
jgi:hypothetical protein